MSTHCWSEVLGRNLFLLRSEQAEAAVTEISAGDMLRRLSRREKGESNPGESDALTMTQMSDQGLTAFSNTAERT